MRVVIVGAGAMGSLVGGLLAESGLETVLYDISQQQVKAIREHGLRIQRDGKERTVRIQATSRPEEIGRADLLIVLVKSYDTTTAMAAVRAAIGPETAVLTLQNGLGNVEAITAQVPSSQVLVGISAHGAMLLGPGHVRHSGGAHTFVGPAAAGDSEAARKIAALLTRAGLKTEVSDQIWREVWRKLMANVAINPLTALTAQANGGLLQEKGLDQMMAQLVREAMTVAAAEGIDLGQDPLANVKAICQATASNRSSMLMDILGGRRTEIAAINGMIVQLAEKNGLQVPLNQMMVWLVSALEKRRIDCCQQ